jgi:hypothetical protein
MDGRIAQCSDTQPPSLRARCHSEFPSSALCSSQSRLGALRDHLSLLLGKRCIDVKGEFVAVFAERGDHEMDPMLHESADEVHVARQTVEPGNDQRATRGLCLSKRDG